MKTVRVETPARLHWGMFDVNGTLGRRFGGLGVAITRPMIVLEATAADQLTVQGPGADRAAAFARHYLDSTGIPGGANIHVSQMIPGHVGLGSGTKLALTVAYALALLYNQPTEPNRLAQNVGRKTRSAVGMWTFVKGGLVVEGGRRPENDSSAPLLLRYPMPSEWRCVVAIPEQWAGLNGPAEVEAFAKLSPTLDQSAKISHVTLMSLLPALVEQNATEFGAALTKIQQLVGECFSPVQGGNFSNPLLAQLIELFLEWGAAGAGQSSWGPTVYGLVANEKQGQQLVERTKAHLNGRGWVELVSFDNNGVRIQYA